MANRYTHGDIDYTNRGYDQVRFRVPSQAEGAGGPTRDTEGGSFASRGIGSGSGMAGRGPYRGLGPRNYRRSDTRILEDVCDGLTEHGYLDARNMEVQVVDGVVALDGTVNDQYSRRIAQDLAEAVSGVVQVQNNLRVNYPFPAGEVSQPALLADSADPRLSVPAEGPGLGDQPGELSH